MAKSMPKSFAGKSTKLGQGGRAAMLKSALEKKGLPKKEIGGIIGKRARAEQAAPGQKNFHGKKKKGSSSLSEMEKKLGVMNT